MLNRALKWCYKFAFASWDIEFTVRLKRHNLRQHVAKVGLVAVPLAAISYGIINFVNAPPHDFSASDCFGCHFTIPQDGDPRPYKFTGPIKALCLRCHSNLNIVTHYVNATTAVSFEPAFPVVDAQSLTCATCHDPHVAYNNPTTGDETYLLRAGLSGEQLCAKCHEIMDAKHNFFAHTHAMDRAHGFSNYSVLGFRNFSVSIVHTRVLAWLREPKVKLDRLSMECLGCHDNPASPELTSPGSTAFAHGPDIGISHVIGINYSDAAWHDREIKQDAGPSLILFDGNMGCCTCHDPYQPGGGVCLRVGAKGSFQTLCMTCHIR